jgi:hypothetical protein
MLKIVFQLNFENELILFINYYIEFTLLYFNYLILFYLIYLIYLLYYTLIT